MAEFSTWIQLNFEEIIGTLVTLLYLYFSIIQNKWLWPIGFISSLIYALVFFKKGIYANMGLQLYYVVVSIYGWFNWTKMQENKDEVQIKSIFYRQYLLIWLIVIAILLFFTLSQILKNYTDSTIPYIDAFTTALSITATWMLAKKYIEHWLIWIVVDTVSIGIYFYKELYVTIFLYTILTISAIVGYIMWIKSMRNCKIEIVKKTI